MGISSPFRLTNDWTDSVFGVSYSNPSRSCPGTDRWARRTRAFHNQTTEGAQLLTPGFCQNSENILMTHFLLQPCLVPFLKKSLPYLQQSLAMRELTIEGVNPPNASQVGKLPPAMSVAGISAPSSSLPIQRPAQPRIAMPTQRPVGVFRQPAPQPGRFGGGQQHTLLPQPKAPQVRFITSPSFS